MPQLTISEEQVLELLLQLSPEGKRKAFEQLLQEIDWEQLSERVRKRWAEICASEGIDWNKLSDEEKEAVLDGWLRRPQSCRKF
ncbi:MAG: hypothetical protein N3B10_00345 [Armatimonadetes bacterium]|nr:hypothetical protein [Armatimonadota bacterium]MCX7966918.1 hypothetical protein [Armatimonadota bacterium]MDW8141875.1 hypothetical protein [Armatimonadota bacterium]